MGTFSLRLEDSCGEMRELADSILSIKFRDTSLPMELLPIISPAGLASLQERGTYERPDGGPEARPRLGL